MTQPQTDQPTPISIYFLLDRSGSMETIRQATIEGINGFIAGQKRNGVPTTMTLALFDANGSGMQIVRPFECRDIQEVQQLTDFNPRGNTPLLDAFGESIDWFELKMSGKPDRVLFVVMTDGEENSSKSWTQAKLKERVLGKTAQGWEFVYLGANQDAFQVGASMGIAAGNTQSYDATPKGVMRASSAMTVNTASFACAGATYSPGTFFGDNAQVEAHDTKQGHPSADVTAAAQTKPGNDGLTWK